MSETDKWEQGQQILASNTWLDLGETSQGNLHRSPRNNPLNMF